jgi:hypothetical protein
MPEIDAHCQRDDGHANMARIWHGEQERTTSNHEGEAAVHGFTTIAA